MTITSKSKGAGPPATPLSGELMDEAALAGGLSALYDLGYSLQLVRKVERKE